MYHPEYLEALKLAQNLHKKYRGKITPSIKDLRLAIYYLQGGCLTQAHFAIKSWAIGDLNTPFRAKRFIDECKQLIFGLVVAKEKDRDRYLKRFYKDEIVTLDIKTIEKEVLALGVIDKDYFDTWMKHADDLSHGFSKGVHPNLESVAYNSDTITGEFDYEAENFAHFPIRNFDFAHFVIIPAIDSVIISASLFQITDEELEPLNKIRDRIQSIALNNHRNKSHTQVSNDV